jgi:hypothetical protein
MSFLILFLLENLNAEAQRMQRSTEKTQVEEGWDPRCVLAKDTGDAESDCNDTAVQGTYWSCPSLQVSASSAPLRLMLERFN